MGDLQPPKFRQAVVASMPILLLIIALAAVFAFMQARQTSLQAIAEVSSELQALAADQRQQLSNPIQHLQGTARAPAMMAVYPQPISSDKIAIVTNELSSLVYRNPDYYQARWLSPQGDELVRIEFIDGQIVNGQERLQNKSHRSYHQHALAGDPFDVYIGPPSLNREFGEIVLPIQPTIRYAINLPNNNGYLIINYLIEPKLWAGAYSVPFRLAAENGDWIVHEDVNKLWASEYGHDFRVDHQFPNVFNSEQGFADLEGEHWLWKQVQPAGNSYYSGDIYSRTRLAMFASVNQQQVGMFVSWQLAPTWLVALLLLIASVGWVRKNQLHKHQSRLHELQLAERTALAEKNAQAKSQFLANMSHEIRTPMNAIVGFVQVLKQSSLNEQQRQQLGHISRATESLTTIINDILDLSKLEAGKMSLSPRPVNLTELFESTVSLYSDVAKAKDLQLRLNVSPDIDHLVVVDDQRLGQILNNLVSNAIKFTERGSVEIGVVVQEQTSQAYQLRFFVADTGKGISRDKLNNIFVQFSQEDDSITRKFGGTGLGLTICNSLLELMSSAHLQVESELGEGSRFSFLLTLAKAGDIKSTEKLASTHVEANELPQFPNAKVVVVDDTHANLLVAQAMLGLFGVVPITFESGGAFLAWQANEQFDLLFLDIHMPQLSGYQVAQQLRQTGLLAPIVALSAAAMPEDIAQAKKAGMTSHLPKPFTIDQLADVLALYLDATDET
ncbi:ATP-binding protein [Salinibius halmophilus]|uniref:ATP-binding protein n=1 Tax=Salinibius halmophilus TaxID=1853216 RepID=UPI000E67585D|nr:ATP-binding protein [Salinibius halmophilus]